MFNRTRIARAIVASLIIITISAITFASPWTQALSLLGFASAESSPNIVEAAPATFYTVGTCDTAGPIEVESTLPSGPTAYPTLSAAFAAINAGTHQGAINVEVCANSTETAATVLNSSGAGSANYTSISIRPLVDGVTISGPTVSGRGLIELNGADNVTIDGDNPNTVGTNRNLAITNTAATATTYTSVIRIALATSIVTSADNVIIRNLAIKGSATSRNGSTFTSTTGAETNTYGILASAGASTVSATTAPSTVTSITSTIGSPATASNLQISNNSITSAGRGVSIQGGATTVFPGLQISNNTIGNSTIGNADGVYTNGIGVNGSANALISGNSVSVEGWLPSSSSANNQAVYVGTISSSTTGATIENNYVIKAMNNNSGGYPAIGINLGGGNSHVVRNNFVRGVMNIPNGTFSTTFGAFGIRIGTGTGHTIFHNSVFMSGDLTGNTGTALTSALGIVTTSSTGMSILNNILGNIQTQTSAAVPSGSSFVSLYLPTGATGSMNLTLNNNDYYTGGAVNNGVGQVGATSGSGLYTAANFDPTTTTPASNLRSYTSPLSAALTNDNASKKVDPIFVSATDLHIQSSSTMESAGANAGVTTDIDGDSRGATPDIGADEITLAGPGTVQFSTTSYTNSEGNTATITVNRTGGVSGAISVDYAAGGGTATGGAACTAGVDYITPTPGTLSWANADAAAKTFNVQLCTDTDTPETESLDLTLSNPIGTSITGTNPVPLNITDVPPPLNGDYQVPGDYATLTAAVADYNVRGVSGPVRFLLNNATYDTGAGETFPIVIATTGPDTTATNTLTIQPNAGITSAIVGSSASGIVVIGDQFVTINGDNVGGDVARNLTVNNTATTANSYVVGLFNFGGTKVARNATVRYSNIRGGVTVAGTVSWGIILNGSGGDYDNVLIENNKIWQAYVGIGHYGVAATGINNNNIIRNNIIGDTTGSNESIKLRGIEVTQSSGLTIDGNDVFGLPAGNSNSTQAGILLSTGGANNTVTRNNIHDFYYIGTGGLSTHGILISENGGTTNITNNFIHNIKADGDVFNTATNILWMPAGITISGTTTGTLNIDHNSIYMSGATLGSTFTGNSACFSSVAGVTGVNFRNNALRNSMTTVGAPDPDNKTYAIATIGAGSLGTMFSAIDNNTYFVNGSNPNIGTFGQTDRVNLAAFQAATTQDASSLDVDPQFISTSDLHLNVVGHLLIGGGTTLPGLTVDYDNDPRPASNPDIGADEIVQAEGGVIPAGTFYNVSFNIGNTLAGNLTVNNRLYLFTVMNPGSSSITLGCNAVAVNASSVSYINGAVTKNYCGAENFTFPVGDGGFYSPANVNVTAVGVVPSSLTVTPYDATLGGFDPSTSLSRNWNLEETGDLTADLLFYYDDADVNGTESDYRAYKRAGNGVVTAECGGPCVDTVNNIIGPVSGVSSFSRWTGAGPLAPTAADVSLSGRVTTADGRGVTNAVIVLTGNALAQPMMVKTGSFGYYRFDNLEAGETYIVTVNSKRFIFSVPSRVVSVPDNVSNIDFVAMPE